MVRRKIYTFITALFFMSLLTSCGKKYEISPQNYTVTNQENGFISITASDNENAVFSQIDCSEYGGMGEGFIDFYSETDGYVLYVSDPGLGATNKILYQTDDSADSFSLVCDFSDQIRNYPVDFAFSDEKNGILLAKYYGEDAFVYITEDGGKNWTPYNPEGIEIAPEVTYVNGMSIDRTTDGSWVMQLEFVSNSNTKVRTFISTDNWQTWEKYKNN